MMNTDYGAQVLERVAGAVCLLTVACSAAYFTYDSHLTQVQARLAVAGLTATVNDVNAPCTGFHGSVSCGVLAQVSQTTKNVGILAAQSAEQVRQTGALVTATANNLNTVGDAVSASTQHLNAALDATSSAATALTGTANAATGTLSEGQRTLASAQPLLAQLTANGKSLQADTDSLNMRIRDPRVDSLMNYFTQIAQSGTGIMADGKKVADYGTKQLTTPKTFLQRLEERAGDTYDITAWLARHYN